LNPSDKNTGKGNTHVMPNAITNTSSTVNETATKDVAHTAKASPQAALAKPLPTPVAPKTDTVILSKVAQAAVAALKEATETPAQTAKEAVSGDLQAKRLLVKETAARQAALTDPAQVTDRHLF
jgi:hypothetical protein